MRAEKSTILVFIVILFHAVGLAGFAVDTLQPFFLQFVPFHLLLMVIVLCIGHTQVDPKFVLFLLITTFMGFAIEWIGVHKHFIFGTYIYGETLGRKVQGVPLIIGVNWFMLVYATGTLMQNFNQSFLVRIIMGAIIMTMLDVLIEPIATRYDYWHWSYHGIFLTAPLRNYGCWFVVSAGMLGVFELFKFPKQSNVGSILLLAQYTFFILLYFI